MNKQQGSNDSPLLHLTQWKQRIIEMMIQDDELMKLVAYPVTDWARRPNVPMKDRIALVDDQLLKIMYNDDVVVEKKTFISLGISGFVPQESFRQFSYLNVMGYIYFYVLTDRDIMRTDSGIRQDEIVGRLQRIFQGKDFGLGSMQLGSYNELWTQNNKFGGAVIGYQVMAPK